MKVFSAERECGLESDILAKSSLAFVAEIALTEHSEKNVLLDNFLSMAGSSDEDLYHTLSILVSTVQNKNDDIFVKEEVWAARESPRFKPTNLGHDEKHIVGGIINSWPVDEDFKLIADNTKVEDLPDTYHLLVASVIYRSWQDPALKAQAENLIAEIENGSKFVSMECLFRGFDYGITSPNGDHHIIARSEDTAFLTQHLRVYGGKGVYDDHKIGRVLRSITFSGKGYVDRPANPDSIIFDKDYNLSFANVKDGESLFSNSSGVTNNTEMHNSSKQIEENEVSDILTEQVKELKASLVSVQADNKALNDKLSEANVSTYEAKITELETAATASDVKATEAKTAITEATDRVASLETELGEKVEAFDALQAKFDKSEDDKKKKERKEKMTDAGFSAEEVEAKYESFAKMDDVQFNFMIETVAAMKTADTSSDASEESDKKKKDKKKKDDEESNASASDIIDENDEDADDVSLAGDEDNTDENETARAGIQSWIEDRI